MIKNNNLCQRQGLTPKEGETFIFFFVVPELLNPVIARTWDFRQNAGILAGLTQGFARLASQETVSIAAFAKVVEKFTGAISTVEKPPLLGQPLVVFAGLR